jgi:hypothetical protein
MTYEKDPLGAWKEIENKPRVVKFLGGERCRPKENAGVVQLVVGRAPVGENAVLPRYPAAHLQLDLGIVPSAQESTTISNWLQDDITAKLQAAHPEEDIDDKGTGVSYHTGLFRGRFVYMVRAESAVLQEMVASTLNGHEIPMVSPKLYKATKEMADINNGIRAFKDEMAAVVGAGLSSNDRRSPARRYWNTNRDYLTSIVDDEVMSEHGLTDWATATPAQNEQRQQNRTAAKTKCVLEQSALLEASRAVVDYVGNTEMPKWSDGNKEAVESRAIELRHKLTQHLGHTQ